MNGYKMNFACADSKYFLEYAPALCYSAYETDNNLLVCCAFPDEECLKLIDKINKAKLGDVRAMGAEGEPDPKPLSEDQLRVYWASLRYLLMLNLIVDSAEQDEYVQFHSIDIDSLFMQKVEIPDEVKLGLYLRENENLGGNEQERKGMKVLGHTIFSTEVVQYLKRVCAYIQEKNFGYWFLDQEALWECLTQEEKDILWDMKGKNLIDWDFTPEGKIWSGKGPRKFSNETYVKLFNFKTKEFYESLRTRGL